MPDRITEDVATRAYADHRELLFSVVYNLLGSVADTEDVLQDTWLSWTARHAADGADGIENPRAYLVRIAVNTALARQADISRRRETYLGPWLPEPLVSQPDAGVSAERTEAVSMALLVVLETLTPLERAVFVLREVFGYAHTEIATILDRSPSAVRQLAHRAREHVHARRPRCQADPKVQRQVTERFLKAALGGDLAGLLELMAPDVTLWRDAGGARGPLRPVHGRDKVARVISATARQEDAERLDVRYRTVNGDPSAVLFDADAPFAVMVLDLAPDDERVRGIYAVANPDKLSHIDEK
ncbi:RNA polymerase sigma-70 factor (ECF subfamily) [Actinomadura pelletieri DSM 43383]|uniref:RNA polymerase sigma-70 factor (ECF subfamily) n=1 Tax=Actinomadura pelletieri DSM 43383 TaxID=1120940 RepID=A0A495QIF2_9ACTN|nr:RNA polymerase sigma factor SigJ [Actinomadura pelletieri]RKS71909.1 RNA polymerase sigma-70 factor (ECF subfamily) [Actinomadura pelletieri DSM 43383]